MFFACLSLGLGKGCEGWGKGGQKVGEARQFPPFAHTRGKKDGERVVESREQSENSHPSPIQGVRRMGKGWTKGGQSQANLTLPSKKGASSKPPLPNFPNPETAKIKCL